MTEAAYLITAALGYGEAGVLLPRPPRFGFNEPARII